MADNVTVTNTKTAFDASTNPDYVAKTTEESGKHIQHIISYSALIPKIYDYISLTYTGSDLTGVVYKTGGSGGTTVATLALVYSSSVLQTVTRT